MMCLVYTFLGQSFCGRLLKSLAREMGPRRLLLLKLRKSILNFSLNVTQFPIKLLY